MKSLLLALPLAALAAGPVGAAPAAKPNVVLIVADDLGYADLGVQGGKEIPTPHLDALAARGTRFTGGYVSCPVCSPTRAGLMTGRYQQRFGHEFNPGPVAADNFGLSRKETTVAERLKGAGYRTGMVGKWHLGHRDEFVPTRRGFDEFYGFLGGHHSYTKAGSGADAILRGTSPANEKAYLTDAFGREAADFIGRQKGQPFFLYLPFNAVHTPMEATNKYLARVAPSVGDGKRRTYAAMVLAMDDAVGRVLAKLKETGADQNTLIAFISDNGGPEQANASDNGPLHGGKGSTWEGGVRVPFFVSWPAGNVPAGQTDDRPVIQLDLVPTLLAAAGVEAPADAKFDGVNLLPYLTGQKADAPHAALYWRFGAQTAVRAGDWKLTKANEPGASRAGGGAASRREEGSIDGAKLFHLKDDIGEETDLAAKQPEKVKELTALWKAWDADNAPPAWVQGGQRKQAN